MRKLLWHLALASLANNSRSRECHKLLPQAYPPHKEQEQQPLSRVFVTFRYLNLFCKHSLFCLLFVRQRIEGDQCDTANYLVKSQRRRVRVCVCPIIRQDKCFFVRLSDIKQKWFDDI